MGSAEKYHAGYAVDTSMSEGDQLEPATCAHCEGAGCTYCDKRGFVLVNRPKQRCRHCEGDGCFYCGFTGWSGIYIERLHKRCGTADDQKS
jgi:DnaJ-class molecular chaperone